jgi:hypothetical protein
MLLDEMQKLNFDFNSTHLELCNANKKMEEVVATADLSLKASIRELREVKAELGEVLQLVARSGADAIKFKREASKAVDLLHTRCAELEEENRLLQIEIQVQAIIF